MATQITEGIKVSVETEYQDGFSDPSSLHYVFTYKITIENNSPFSIQLMHRYWFIADINQPTKEVEGPGVVGQQPVIEPGRMHQYVSGCQLSSGFGKMHGYYLMERLIDGKEIKVEIPEFTMVAPQFLN
jgi:ApaG protein